MYSPDCRDADRLALMTARFADTASSGDGARLYGGRWNCKGVPLVYAAGSQSLAMLEMLVQDEPLRARYVMIRVRIPGEVRIRYLKIGDLPRDWRNLAAREQLQNIGTEWARKLTGAVLSVPSAVIPSESNYLINPLHSDFNRIEFGKPEAFVTDVRLLRK